MPPAPQPARSQPLRVVHFARTALASGALERAMIRPGVEFRQVDRFDDLLAQTATADLILLTDPGPGLAPDRKSVV